MIFKTLIKKPIVIIVLRSMLGFTPPEWAYVANQKYDSSIDQGFIRGIDRKIRIAPLQGLKITST